MLGPAAPNSAVGVERHATKDAASANGWVDDDDALAGGAGGCRGGEQRVRVGGGAEANQTRVVVGLAGPQAAYFVRAWVATSVRLSEGRGSRSPRRDRAVPSPSLLKCAGAAGRGSGVSVRACWPNYRVRPAHARSGL